MLIVIFIIIKLRTLRINKEENYFCQCCNKYIDNKKWNETKNIFVIIEFFLILLIPNVIDLADIPNYL